MLNRSDLQRMRHADFAGVFTRKTELLDHIDEQQAEIERLEGINEVLDETMRSFAGQRLETEMPDDERENGDYRGAYDCMVRTARAAYLAAYPREDT